MKYAIIGILFTIALLLIPTKSKCQIGSEDFTKTDNCYFCADSIVYLGIVKLYTEYNAQNEFIEDLGYRFDMLDSAYQIQNECLKSALNRLETVNYSRDSIQRANKLYEFKTEQLETQKKKWRFYGVASTVTFIAVIILLL